MSNLRPSLAFLFLGSLLAFSFACGGGDDDDDKANTSTNTPGAMGTPGGTASNGGIDAGVSPLGGLGGLLGDADLSGIFGEGGISLDPNQACSFQPDLCPDGSFDPNALSAAACRLDPTLCPDAAPGGNFIGNLGGIFGGLGRNDAGGGPGGSGSNTPSDAGGSSSSDAASASDAGSASSDAAASGDAR